MKYNNEELINKSTITSGTTLEDGGRLNPEQAEEFFRMTFESAPFSQLHRRVQRRAKQGEIDKIAIGGRLLRKKEEDTDDGYRAGVSTSKLTYNTVAVRLPWEITEETLRENIEGENFEDLVMDMMTTQVGLDSEDLNFNGDTDIAEEEEDYPFLSINDGWLKQMTQHGYIDNASENVEDSFGKHTFFTITKEMPNKYKNNNLRWLMSPYRRELWMQYLTERQTGAGDSALLAAGDAINQPLGYQIVAIPALPDDVILLADPMNFVVVWTYDVRIRRTMEGEKAIMQDKRFYVIHFDSDPIIQEKDAVVMLKNVPETLATV